MGSLPRFIIFVGVVVLGISVVYLGRRLDLVKSAAVQPEASGPFPGLAALDSELTRLIGNAVPSVVSISARQYDPATDQLRRIHDMLGIQEPAGVKTPELGSGIIVSNEGHIVTNLHVVNQAREVTVYLSDGRMLSAHLLGADPLVDLAILKVDAGNLPALPFADSDNVRVGQMVFAIGNPLGLQETVTQGIISGIGRRGVNDLNAEFFQTDAAINPGNSGGPLINVRGEMVAVNNSIALKSQGISFAIPSNLARRVYEDVVERREISRPWFGAITWPLSPDVANRLGLPVSQGCLIARVLEGSPAARAGLVAGDVIEAINGKPARNGPEIRSRLAELKVGDIASMTIVRDGKRTEVPIKVEQHPPNP
jgi:S1-C subfamily serine protease